MASTKNNLHVLDICTRSKDGEQSWDRYVMSVLDIWSAPETQRKFKASKYLYVSSTLTVYLARECTGNPKKSISYQVPVY